MVADYFTKTLQGSSVKKVRDIIIGLVNFRDEEHVESCQKVTTISSVQNKESRTEIKSRLKITNIERMEGGGI